MEEIKSVRVRRIFESSSTLQLESVTINLSGSQFDIKVTIYKESRKKSLIGFNQNGSEEWKKTSYRDSGRYSDFSNDDLIKDFISVNSKRLNGNFEIIQDPYLEKPPKERSFGFDPYYLNNGAKILIKWLDGNFSVGGKGWSDLNGNELDIQKGQTQSTKGFITKTAEVGSPGSYEGVNKFLKLTSMGLESKSDIQLKEFSGTVDDKDIIEIILYQWKRQVPNYDNLALCEPNNEFCELIDFINPVDELEQSETLEDNKLVSEDPISDNKIKLSFEIDKNLKLKPREDFNFKLFIGEPPQDPNLEGFDFGDGEQDLSLLDDEFLEEESVIVNGEKIILFDNSELNRDSGVEEDSGLIETGGSEVNSPNIVIGSSIVLPPDLKSVQNSSVLLKQSTGKKENPFRNINSDIKSPKGDVIKGSEIVRNMNTFITDILGPFASYLKTNYPNLYKDWYITSSTRGYVPNGGSITSQHFRGQAIDSQILGSRATNPQRNIELLNAIFKWYKENPFGYGQILFETRGNSCWIHWSYTRGNKKLHFARFKDDRTLIGASANTIGKYILSPLNQSNLGFSIV